MKFLTTKAVFIIAFVVIICIYLNAQNNEVSKVVKDNYKYKLDSIVQISNYHSHHKDWNQYYQCLRQLYFLSFKYRKMEGTLPFIQKAVNQIPIAEDTFYNKGQLLLATFQEAIGNTFNSQKIHEQLIHSSKNSVVNPYLHYSCNGLGVHYTKIRDYNQAIYILKSGIIFAKSKKDTTYLKILHNNLGIALSWKGQYKEAHNQLDSSKIYIKNDYSSYFLEKASVYLFQNKLDSASMMIVKADNAARYYLNDKIYFYTSFLKGKIFEKKGELLKAENAYKHVLQMNTVEDKRERLKVIIPLVNVLVLQDKFAEAFKNIELALVLFKPNLKFTADKPVGIEMNFIELFELEAKCHLKQFALSGNINSIYEAEKSYDKSLSIIYNMRYILDNFSANEYLAKSSKPIFESRIKIAHQLYQHSKNKKHLHKAFEVAQNFSSFNLKRTISERQALTKYIKSKEIINYYLKTKSDYLDSEYNIFKQYDDNNSKLYEQNKKKFLTLQDSLIKNNEGFRKKVIELPGNSIKDIQEKLIPLDVFIQYFISNQKIYTFTITKNSFSLDETDIDTSFLNSINSFHQFLSDPNLASPGKSSVIREKYFETSYYLFKKLVEPSLVGKEVKKLILVPDAFLFRIPFEAFTTSPNPADQSYLIKDYTLNYHYYAAQFTTKEEYGNLGDFMGLGLEYDKYTLESMKEYKKNDSLPQWINESFRSDKLSPLLFADDEVTKIADLLGGQIYINQGATRSNFLKHAKENQFIHVSAHSFVDYENPVNSSIVLHKSNINDNNLVKVSDIAEESYNDLLMVTLSTCHSSIGTISETNGISSLTKAFFEAGSKSVLGSYWAVPDQYSMIFMTDFYKYLDEGMSKDEALRKTKLDAINGLLDINPAYNHPSFWSSWIVYGDVRPIDTTFWTWNKGLILLLCLGLVSILILFWYKINFN